MNSSIRAAIAAIGEDLDPDPVSPRDLGRPARRLGFRRRGRRSAVHGVRVEERPGGHRPADRAPGPRPEQAGRGRAGRAVPAWRHHAVFSDSPFELVQAEGQHRDHAVVEQVFADVTSGPLAHMPSGVFTANAAWLSIAAMAHNLLRAAGSLASLPFAKARAATIRRDLIAVAARIARHGRGHLTLHLPEGWTANTNGNLALNYGRSASRSSRKWRTTEEPTQRPRLHPCPTTECTIP